MNKSPRLSGRVITPQDETFRELIRNYNLYYRYTPKLFVYPEEICDIVAALNYARYHSIRMKCRGTGFSPAAHSNENNALILNLSHFKQFKFDRHNECVTIGSGYTHQELNDKLSLYGYHYPGLIFQQVSVVGFLSGGGISLSSRFLGLGCDHLVEVKLMDTNGTLLTASNKMNRDLFWAIRGGGGNRFGIIIELTLKVYPIKSVTTFNLYYPKQARKLVISSLHPLYHQLDSRISVMLEVSQNECLVKGLSYLSIQRTQDELISLLKLKELTNHSFKSTNYLESLKMLDLMNPIPHYFKHASHFIYEPLSEPLVQSLLSSIDSHPKLILSLVLLGGKILKNKGYNSCFNHREAVFLLQAYTTWESDERSDIYIKSIEDINEIFFPVPMNGYINIPENHFDKVSKSYFPTHLHALSAIKLKYNLEGHLLS